jgi:hypothetical protein
VALFAGLVGLAGCKRATTPTPQRLRAAQLAAMQGDDPEAAYALLSPAAQARTPKAEFVARFRDQKAERAAMVTAAKAADASAPVLEGTTLHDGGRALSWTWIDDRYWVVDGLPGRQRAATPAEAIHAFLDAVRRTDLSAVSATLGESLVEAIDEDWQARADAIEQALQDPGAIELSADAQRAELRYEPERALRLEQSPEGWRITALE